MARQKGKGSRIVFVVNEQNPREKRIYDFLEQQYNKSDTIKSILSKLLEGKPVDMSEYCDMNCVIPPVESKNEMIEVEQQTTEVKNTTNVSNSKADKVEEKKEEKEVSEVQANIMQEWNSYRM